VGEVAHEQDLAYAGPDRVISHFRARGPRTRTGAGERQSGKNDEATPSAPIG
jgi:hypothetical protein